MFRAQYINATHFLKIRKKINFHHIFINKKVLDLFHKGRTFSQAHFVEQFARTNYPVKNFKVKSSYLCLNSTIEVITMNSCTTIITNIQSFNPKMSLEILSFLKVKNTVATI